MCYCGRNPRVIQCGECPPGSTGPQGRSLAFQMVQESPGVNCLYGGVKMVAGYDDDNDGTIDVVICTQYFCQTAPASPGVTPTFVTGTITALAANADPTFSLTATGNPNEYAINLGIPVSGSGATPTLVAGTITQLPYGDPITFSLVATGNPDEYALNLGLPAGAPGSTTSAGTIVSGLTIPDCFTGTVNNGDTLTQFIQAILNAICSSSLQSGNVFRAINIYEMGGNDVNGRYQPFTAAPDDLFTGTQVIPFTDDYNLGIDPGDSFHALEFTANTNLSNVKFFLEGLLFKNVSSSTKSFIHQFKIIKNSSGVFSTLADSGSITRTGGGGSSFLIPTIDTGFINLLSGDKVYCTMSRYAFTAAWHIMPGGKFSNKFQ